MRSLHVKEDAGSRNGTGLLFSNAKLRLRVSFSYDTNNIQKELVRGSFHSAASIFCICLAWAVRDLEVTVFYNLVYKDLVISLATNMMYR